MELIGIQWNKMELSGINYSSSLLQWAQRAPVKPFLLNPKMLSRDSPSSPKGQGRGKSSAQCQEGLGMGGTEGNISNSHLVGPGHEQDFGSLVL